LIEGQPQANVPAAGGGVNLPGVAREKTSAVPRNSGVSGVSSPPSPSSEARKEVVPVNDAEYQRRLTAYEAEMAELREQAKTLEEEVISLRRRLQDAPKRVRTLEERLLETKGQLAQAVSQNEKLTYTLHPPRGA
jgi:septal ring factor EnvC (AmiA/AmiB activator)